MIRTCLFDLGNVLVHFSHEQMCAQMGAVCGRSGAEVRALLFDSGLLYDFERGRLDEAEVHRRFEDFVGEPVDADRLREAGSDIFRVNESAVRLLDELKERGQRLVLFSNTSVSHFQWVASRFDVLERFDELVVSFRVGAIKPERPMYEAALKRIACAPSECFYTDDVPEYVRRGREFGFEAEIFRDTPTLAGELSRRGVPVDVSAFGPAE